MLLQSERLSLRPFTPEDRQQIFALLADRGFMEWSVRGLLRGAVAEARLVGLMEGVQRTGFGKLAVRRRDEGRILGYCGIEQDSLEGRPEMELGFRIAPRERRQGIASEAARLVIADYFARSGAGYLLAYVETANAPSLAAIEKLGFVFQRTIHYQERAFRLFRLERGDR